MSDHLGGTNVTARGTDGVELGKVLYRPWGETRFSTGTTPTTWRFTGQREDVTIGLYYFNARYLDPVLGRFTQPDTIVPEPGNPQALNRYSYVLNNPLRYTDPSGHAQVCADGDQGGGCGDNDAWYRLTQQWYGIGDQGLLDATILAWLQDHQDIRTIQAMAGYLEAHYGQSGAILPSSFNTIYAHAFAAGELAQLATNSMAQLLAGAIFAGVGIGGANLGGLKREIAGYSPRFAYLQGGDPKTVVPDSYVIVRGGQSQLPPPGTVFSGSQGATLSEAASGVPHGSIRVTTAGEIRARGGVVVFAPEPSRSGMVNWLHVNVAEGSAMSTFGDITPNPVPKNMRVN